MWRAADIMPSLPANRHHRTAEDRVHVTRGDK
jgi:hypothetical protein